MFPPDLVTALITPPIAPPYSAGMPVVLTCTSWTYSNAASWRDRPVYRLPVATPSIVNAFSALLAPLTWMPPSMAPVLTDGAVTASDWKLRVLGSRSNSSSVTFCATTAPRTSISGGGSAATRTVSLTLPSLSVPSARNVFPRSTATSGISLRANPVSSKLTA